MGRLGAAPQHHPRLARRVLGPVAAAALDQRVGEGGFVVILAGNDDDLAPDAGIYDPIVVELGAEALGVDNRKRVASAVHTPPAVASADDSDEFACLGVIVGRKELHQWLLRASAAQEGDDVLSVASPLVLADRLAEPDLNSALRARRAHEHPIAGVAIAPLRPPVRLA